jgi:DNA-binding CsgD family transcriptional regulator
MSLRLASGDLSALAQASTVLLTPFSYESGETWQRAACKAVETVVGADASGLFLSVSGQYSVGGEPDVVSILRTISAPLPEWIEDRLTVHQRHRQFDVANWTDLFDETAVRRSAFYNDVVAPERLLAPITMLDDVLPGELPSGLAVYFGDERAASALVSERKHKLGLLFPSFRAGVRAYLRYDGLRAGALAVAETSTQGVLIFDLAGRLCYENPAVAPMLSCDPERERVRREVAFIAAGLGAIGVRNDRSRLAVRKAGSEVRTRASRYRISAVFMNEGWSPGGEKVLILLDLITPRAPDAKELTMRFRLSPREIEIAQLLRHGFSSRQIGTALGIAVNTARRHTERILVKLDVHSRAAAAARLAGN